ncbi:hypothetical protein HY407_04470 [Candidatus Gottesmanbacteria bacterium]|nr:hypothetical protein [Candidatus Gottesmanbacteria bacterium]
MSAKAQAKAVIVRGYRSVYERNVGFRHVEELIVSTVEELEKAISELERKRLFLNYSREDGTPITGRADDAKDYLRS